MIRAWSDALRRGDVGGAARYFAIPSVMINGTDAAGSALVIPIGTADEAVQANASLPCGALLLSADQRGRYVNALFRLTGRPGLGGGIVTAGGLVFIGASNDARFRAFDSKTGKELWAVKLDNPANATPMTYQAKNGKQYVAVVASQALVVFALP